MNVTKSLFAASALLFANSAIAADDKKPNILLLLADDMGYNELGCYGQEVIQTPVLDNLAANGLRFTDFHAGNAVSSASRAVLMTGKHAGVNTIRGNQGYQMENGGTRVALKKEEITMAEMLRSNGYQTAFVGKWHLEDPCDLSTWAYGRGFDFAAQEQWDDKNCMGAYTLDMEYINGVQDSLYYDETKWDCKDEFRTQIAFDYFDNKFEHSQFDKEKPFFLFMSYRAPHAHEWYINNKELYADQGWSEAERMHAAKVTLLDKQIGRMLEKLEEMGELDNTLVIFTSDNGPQNEGHDYEFFDSNGDLRGFKRDMFEGGHRVPCIVYWKGKIQAGNVSDFIASGHDIMPTVAAATGIKTPKQCTGLPLTDLLTKGKEPNRDTQYWELYDSGFSRQAVRMGNWKAVRYGQNYDIRLYNLDNDISESKDVAAEYPEIVKRITPLFSKMRTENKYFPLHDENLAARFLKTNARKEQLFNNGWKFTLGDNPQYRDPAYDDSAWRSLTLPHDWSVELDYNPDAPSGGNNGFFDEGLGWYRKEFTVNAPNKDRQFVVQFDGVFMNSEVWINGTFLGRRPYGYSTFQYDITAYLNYGEGETNTIAVRVDNSNPKASRWYNGSGIYRNVHLIETNYTHFNNYDGIYITTPVAEADRAVVHVEYKAIASYLTEEDLAYARKNKYGRESKAYACEIRSIVYDATGNEVSRTVEPITINTFDKYVRHTQEVEVKNPLRWSAETPTMYYLRSEIVLENKVIDDKITPFGIRKVDFNKDKGLLINDKQVKLNGVCLHHDAASLGAAVPDEVWVYRLQKLRAMGCNAIRTSHNPFSPEFYHICDTMGFYVKNECFDEWKDDWPYNPAENAVGKAQNSYHHYFDQWAETDLSDMIRRDRNHPSVIMYGIGNEVPFFRDEKAYEIVRDLVAICHREDPTRPVALGNNASDYTTYNGVDDELDIMGYNYIMRQHPDSLYAPNRKLMPNKLFFGSETDRNIKYFLAYRDNDYVIGQFIWTGIDYLGETREAPQRGWQKSLLDVTCNPRTGGLQFECCWSSEPKVRLSVADNHGETGKLVYKHGITHTAVKDTEVTYDFLQSWSWDKGTNTLVRVYSNCEEVALYLNGSKVGSKKNDFDNYYVTFEVPYKAGKLQAYGYNKGKRVTSDLLQSATAATAVKANATTSTLKADGRAVSIIEVSIVDAKGNRVDTATNNVTVEVSGNAKFIGMDTGNLFYDGNFKTPNRNATNGKLLIYVQSTGKPGKAEVKLTSDGLKSTSLTLEAK